MPSKFELPRDRAMLTRFFVSQMTAHRIDLQRSRRVLRPAVAAMMLSAVCAQSAAAAQPAVAQRAANIVRTTAQPAEMAAPAGKLAEPDGDYGDRSDAQAFVQEMAQRHGFSAEELDRLFARTRRTPDVLRLISPAAPTFKRSWTAYRARFLDSVRIREGLRFWREHADALARASAEYGVPEEIIVSIIGVETVYGRNAGTFRVMDALATLAFDYPQRAAYFRGELEQFLLYTRESGLDPMSVRGSFAGAIGLPQFMPTSLRSYATDFDGDGRIDLRGNPTDAIGSVARFLALHGWKPGARTHYPVKLAADAGVTPLIDAGIEPRFTVEQLQPYGVRPANAEPPADEKLALIDLPDGDAPTLYWLGANNFYVVTRYNRSSFYAMAVIDLAETLRAARNAR